MTLSTLGGKLGSGRLVAIAVRAVGFFAVFAVFGFAFACAVFLTEDLGFALCAVAFFSGFVCFADAGFAFVAVVFFVAVVVFAFAMINSSCRCYD